MSDLEVAQRYLDAWNARDAAAISATFTADGTYRDPAAGEIPGTAVGAFAEHLWSAFPDLSFQIASVAQAGTGKVVAEWVMQGTNTGSFQGLPPTGRTITLPGVDVIEIGAGGIKAVTGYFDTRALPEQLGLQVLVQPFELGPFGFGYSVAAQSGNKAKPGAFAITSIWNADEDTEEIRTLSRGTATDMLQMDGFIGMAMLRVGNRGVTISAWEKPEQTKQLMRGGTHSEAMKRFWAELGESAFTSVWVPDHINPMWVRCTACSKMVDHARHAGQCGCGQTLPEPPAYF